MKPRTPFYSGCRLPLPETASGSFLTITSSAPPPGAVCTLNSSMNARIKNKPAPRCPQQILFRQRVGDLGKLEALALIEHSHDHFVGVEFHRHKNLLVAYLLISIVIRVDHAFPHRHSHFVDVFFAETCGFRDAHDDYFGEIHALEQRLKRNLDSLGFSSHPRLRNTPKEQYA